MRDIATHSFPSDFDDEARLIEAVRTHHDDNLYTPLVQRYQHRLLRAVYGMVGDWDVAEDITQEAFVKAYLSLGEFRGGSCFYSWLYRIAMNGSRDWLRHQQTIDRCNGFSERNGVETPDHIVFRHELAERIEAALMALPEKYREAFYLKHIEDLPYDEMAVLLSLPVETLKVRVYRARLMLQALLHEEKPSMTWMGRLPGSPTAS